MHKGVCSISACNMAKETPRNDVWPDRPLPPTVRLPRMERARGRWWVASAVQGENTRTGVHSFEVRAAEWE